MANIQSNGQNVSAAWEALVPADPMDNIFARHWLLEQLRGSNGFEKQNGTVIRCNLEYALNPNAKFISELETMSTSRPDTFDYAEYSWKFIACTVPMTDFEYAITSGGASKYDLNAKKLLNMKKTIDELSNTAFFGDGTGTSSKAFGGVQQLVSTTPTTGTVGLVNRATYVFFRNQAKDATKTTTKYDNLVSSFENGYNSASNGPGKENPTFMVSDQVTFEGYGSKVTVNERIVRDGVGDKAIIGMKSQSYYFKDIPYAYDAACLANTAYILNDRNLQFVYMQWQKGEEAVRPADAFYDVFKVLTIGNLVTNNPRRLSVVFNCAS